MIKLKKSLVLLTIVIMAMFLCACGGEKNTNDNISVKQNTPTDAVNEYFTKVEDDEEGEDLINSISEDSLGEEDVFSDEVKNKYIERCKEFTFEVNDENIDGDTAKVNVTANSLDLKDVFKKAASEGMDYVMQQTFSGNEVSDEEMDKYFSNLVIKYLDETELTERTEDISLTKDGDDWKVNEDEDALLRLVTGLDSTMFNE